MDARIHLSRHAVGSTRSVHEATRPSRLDLATKLGRDIPDGWWIVIYPGAGEAVATFRRGKQVDPHPGESLGPESTEDRAHSEAVRRARGAVRRYCAANGLDRLGTLTYR